MNVGDKVYVKYEGIGVVVAINTYDIEVQLHADSEIVACEPAQVEPLR